MTAAMNYRINRSAIDLITMSTSRLIDDTRVRLVIPIRPATATIAEMLAAKGRAA